LVPAAFAAIKLVSSRCLPLRPKKQKEVLSLPLFFFHVSLPLVNHLVLASPVSLLFTTFSRRNLTAAKQKLEYKKSNRLLSDREQYHAGQPGDDVLQLSISQNTRPSTPSTRSEFIDFLHRMTVECKK
jgi:hypothetical protein